MQGLDTSRLLTRGEPFNFRNLMRRASPTVDLAAVIWDEVESQTAFGQIEKKELCDYAQMSYLGGFDQPENKVTAGILEELAVIAGEWGAYGILAELTENSSLFEGFRIAGFSIWARQSIYQLMANTNPRQEQRWRTSTSLDQHSVNKINKRIVPAFSQPMAAVSRKSENRIVACSDDGDFLAYAELYQGPKAWWVQPFILPDADSVGLLRQLANAIPNQNNRPIFLCARSYQPLVAIAAEKLGCRRVSSQTLLVKHLVLRDKVAQSTLQKIFEQGSIEGSLPVSRIKGKST